MYVQTDVCIVWCLSKKLGPCWPLAVKAHVWLHLYEQNDCINTGQLLLIAHCCMPSGAVSQNVHLWWWTMYVDLPQFSFIPCHLKSNLIECMLVWLNQNSQPWISIRIHHYTHIVSYSWLKTNFNTSIAKIIIYIFLIIQTRQSLLISLRFMLHISTQTTHLLANRRVGKPKWL